MHVTAARQSNFEQGVALSLNLWPDLTLAVQNHWGGPDSADKRDWFAGAVVDLFPDLANPPKPTDKPQNGATETEEPDVEYVETMLLQVMLDEFEVNVDDDSGFDVAQEIIRIRAGCLKGDFEEVDALRRKYEGKKGGKVDALFKKAEDQDNDTDWDTEDDEEDSDDDMDDAPPLVETKKEKPPPEVDEDGFTKVTRKR